MFGHVGIQDAAAGKERLRPMLEVTVGSGADQETQVGAGYAFGARRGSLEYSREAGVTVALEGTPRWTERFMEETAISTGAPRAVIEGYARYGEGLLDRMRGAFSLVLFDGKRGRTFLVTDRFGAMPVYYAICDLGLVFGTRARTVLAHDGVSDTLDRQALFNYLYFHVVPAPRTIFTMIKRLVPGTCLVFEGGKARQICYWEPRFEEIQGNAEELGAELRRLLRNSVRHSVNGTTTGAFLSGGTDSSTVVGMMEPVTGSPARTYSVGFEVEGYDETAYARAASRHFKTCHREYYVSPEDVIDALPHVAAYYDQPFGNASAVPVYYCARMARSDGMTRLLAGDGGDEIFGGNYRYAKQNIFARYANLPVGLRKVVIEPLLSSIPFADGVRPIVKLRHYVDQANMPLPDRMETYNLLMRCGGSDVLTTEFMQEVDAEEPIWMMQNVYNSISAKGMLNRMLGLDMRFTLGDSDLCKVSGMCELAGIDVAYPMLDDDLVEFALRLPERYKVNGTRLRYFFKQALSDFLPREVLTKSKHGFGLPFGVWLWSHSGLGTLVRDSLESFKCRGIVRPDFLDQLINERHSEHLAYYGTMIWVLMMLEQWYATRGQG